VNGSRETTVSTNVIAAISEKSDKEVASKPSS
jgi:hypothetical protein